jgi:hypothetical protein
MVPRADMDTLVKGQIRRPCQDRVLGLSSHHLVTVRTALSWLALLRRKYYL